MGDILYRFNSPKCEVIWGSYVNIMCCQQFQSCVDVLSDRVSVWHVNVWTPHQQLCQGGPLSLQPQFTSTMARNRGCRPRQKGVGKKKCVIFVRVWIMFLRPCVSCSMAPPFQTLSAQGDVGMDGAFLQSCCWSTDNRDNKYTYYKT